MLSSMPEMQEKVASVIAMGPPCFLEYMKASVLQNQATARNDLVSWLFFVGLTACMSFNQRVPLFAQALAVLPATLYTSHNYALHLHISTIKTCPRFDSHTTDPIHSSLPLCITLIAICSTFMAQGWEDSSPVASCGHSTDRGLTGGCLKACSQPCG